jgi:hypothetical protein
MPCDTLQALTQLLGCPPITLVKPRDGRFAARGSVPSPRVSRLDVAWRVAAKRFTPPLIVLPVHVFQAASEGAFPWASGLWVIDRGVAQTAPRVLTTRDQEPSLK